jgi:RimJ/RimL family protein N-acetyltransferase
MLIGTKVCLGPVLTEDAPKLLNWQNSLGLCHINGAYRPCDQARFDDWFFGIAKDNSRVVFSIRRQGDLQLLGYLQIVDIHPVHRTGELGILIGNADQQGQGYGQEALSLAITFCWRDLNLQRLSLCVVGENPRAIHVYQKSGFVMEGLRRRAAYVNSSYVDVTLMGLLRGSP